MMRIDYYAADATDNSCVRHTDAAVAIDSNAIDEGVDEWHAREMISHTSCVPWLHHGHRRSQRGESGGPKPPLKGVGKICTTVLVVQKRQILCESLMFSNCECECD